MTTVPPAPPRRLTGDARRWAAAKDEYLAGSPAEAVCRRHDLRLSTFRRHAQQQGWRRMDQPEPDAPPQQDEPLVIPEAPEAPSAPAPLTTSQMVDTCWSHVQAAVAAGQLIQARGWLRLYRELKPLVPYAEIEARRAAPETSPETFPSPDLQPEPPAPDPAADLVRLTTRLAAVARQAETAALQQHIAPPLHCFSAPESHAPRPAADDPPDAPDADAAPDPLPARDLARLIAALQAVTARAEQTLDAETARLPLHSFSPPEFHHSGLGP